MFEKIKSRYMKYYVTDTQLKRYVEIGVLTEKQATEIKQARVDQETGGGQPDPLAEITKKLSEGIALNFRNNKRLVVYLEEV